jgi:hypothetical protein
VEVAALSRFLIFKCLEIKLLLTFFLLEGGLHVEVLALIFLSVELVDSLLGATASIINVIFVR